MLMFGFLKNVLEKTLETKTTSGVFYTEKELLETIIQKLNLDDSPRVKSTLFDLAAKERNDIPADVKDYIMSNQTLLKIIRTAKDKPNSEQLWAHIAKNI